MAIVVKKEKDGRITILSLRGVLLGDLGEEALRDTVKNSLQFGSKKIVIDLLGISYVNSFGLTLLEAIHADILKDRGELVLSNAPSSLKSIIRITGLKKKFLVFEKTEEAIDFLKEKIKINTEERDGVVFIHLIGKITGSTDVSDLEVVIGKLWLLNHKKIIIDLSDVPLINSSGIEFLVILSQKTIWQEICPKIAYVQTMVMEALKKTGADRFFDIYPNPGKALLSFKK